MFNLNSKDELFLMVSSADKDIVLELQKKFKKNHVKVWSMYTDDGGFTTPSGKNHLEYAYKAILRSTMAIILVTENSIKDEHGYIEAELRKYCEVSQKYAGILDMRLVPVYVGKKMNLTESWTRVIADADIYKILQTTYEGKPKQDSLEDIVNELSFDYFEIKLKNKDMLTKDSHLFHEMAVDCVEDDSTSVKTISEDIRESLENDIDSMYLEEMHILSDEILEYDMDPYSLIIITSNILGKVDNERYNPKERGIKYYYYCEESYCNSVEQKYRTALKNYIQRNEVAKKEIVECTRRHLVNRENLIKYFSSRPFNDTIDNFMVFYGIHDRVALEELLNTECQDFLTSDATEFDEIDIVSIPREVYVWLTGVSINKMNLIGKFYIFIERILKLADPSNVNYARLFKVNKLLQALKIFSKNLYLDNEYEKDVEVVQRNNKILDTLIGKKCTNLIKNWFSKNLVENNINECLSDALENIVFIPIKKAEYFRIANSFALFVHRDTNTKVIKKSGAWYSISHNNVQRDNQFEGSEQELLINIYNGNEAFAKRIIEALNKLFEYKIADKSRVSNSLIFGNKVDK
ncbi:MAG: hypothetical protein E7183_06580 [Erysipelotrichaceae bacterium]|nr:hypothetical protein [Erysipelotrichaceae bacterium]